MDHFVSRTQATSAKLDRAGLGDDDRKFISARVYLLPDLQLLNGWENKRKSATLPRRWMDSSDAFVDARSQDSYAHEKELGDWRALPGDLCGFLAFYDMRRQRNVKHFKELLPYKQALQESCP